MTGASLKQESTVFEIVTGGRWIDYSVWVCFMLLGFYGVILLRTAWVSDDAYITFRTVDNFLNGYGLRWNVAERVQSFTHPLWMLLVTIPYFFTREPFHTVTVLSLILSLLTVGILVIRYRTQPVPVALGLLALIFSKAFVDYSTSGLENPLMHLLVVVFALLLEEDRTDAKGLFRVGLAAGFGVLNRMDALLFFIPGIVLILKRFGRLRGLWIMALGFSPFVLWELFSVFYYGIPYPNTGLAKLNTGIPAPELAFQGLRYFENSVRWDPVTLTVIFLGLVVAGVRRRPPEIALGLGVLFYLVYVIRIGGDFMSGRFLSTSVLIAVLILIRPDFFKRGYLKLGFLAVILLLAFIGPFPTVLSGSDYGLKRTNLVDPYGIADERRFYFSTSGLFNGYPDWIRPALQVRSRGQLLKRNGIRLTIEDVVGVVGYFAGPDVHILDNYALCDPLLARMPMVERDSVYVSWIAGVADREPEHPWRVGHFRRVLPAGYLKTMVTGKNEIRDPDVAALYDRLTLVTRGPLWSWKRLVEIVRMNCDYDSYIGKRPRPPYREIDWSEIEFALPSSALRSNHPVSSER